MKCKLSEICCCMLNQGLQSFIPLVINQLGANLKRLQQLGATKVAVTSLEPLGCLPRMTQMSSFQQCNATQNLAVNYHNLLLQQTVSKLNNDTKTSTFFILDLYSSFTTVLQQKGDYQGNNNIISNNSIPFYICVYAVPFFFMVLTNFIQGI